MNEYTIWYQLWGPLVNVNPIFAVKVVKISKTVDSTSPSKSHFGWETTHWGPMPKSLIIYFRVLLQLEPSRSMRQIFVGPRWPADGSHRHPSRHQCCGQALQNHGGPRYQRLSFSHMVRVTLARYHQSKTSTICWAQPHQFFEKTLQSVYSDMSSNMFGTWRAFTTARN